MTDVAVVIPCRNLGQTLGEAIKSVRRQTRSVRELVIVDDGSDDVLTRQILDALRDDGHRILTTPSRGPAAARNAGIAATQSPYVVALDADDWMDDRYIEKTAAVLDSRRDVSFVGSAVHGFGDADWIWTPPPFELAHMVAEAGPPQSSIFRRELWDAVGGYDESIFGYEDIDFWIRAVVHGFRGHLIDEPLLWYRVRVESLHHRAVAEGSHAAGMRAVYNKHRSAIEALGLPLLERKQRDLEAHKANREWLTQRRAAIQHEIAALDSEIDAVRAALAAADVAIVEWGDLRRLGPFSDVWGLDRGRPLDRHYIEQFLSAHRHDIRGHVLEVKDDGYTRQFGAASVTARDVLDINPSNLNATIVADLSRADSVASNVFDCIILTQTLHIIPDIRSALRHARRMLNEGGTLLCTAPVVSRISYEDGGRNGDYWRFTEAGLRLLVAEHFAPEHFQITGYGNVLAATAFLYGLSLHELRPDELDHYDPWFPLLFGVRAVKVSDREGS